MMPAPPTVRDEQLDILKQAILSASELRAKALLLTLIQSSKEARKISLGALTTTLANDKNKAVAPEPSIVAVNLTGEDSAGAIQTKRKRADDDDEPDAPPKALRKRYEWCQQCEEEYDVTKNGPDICTWHPGERQPDYDSDFWADHDEDIHGIIADLGDEYPDGFVWDCCGKNGEIEYCEIGKHQPK